METTTPSSIVPCGTYGYGETEDYLVNITEAPACLPPSSLLATLSAFQATVSWTETGTATSWDVEWGPTPFTPTGVPTISSLPPPGIILNGLLPSTGYAYYVRANCGSSYSTWSGPKNFTTTVSCPAPIMLVSTGITANGATIDWTSTGVETAWDIEYGPAGFVAGSGIGYTEVAGVLSKPYFIGGLIPATMYDFYVRAVCGPGDVSTWSTKGTFTTLCDSYIVPWMEGFEGMPAVGSKILPPCWSYENVEGTSGPYSSATSGAYNGPHTGIKYIYTNYDNTTWVFTPKIHLTARVMYNFSFYMMNKLVTSPVDF
ncbi:MAG: fibronectin type III domain-containing protein [Bacteroidales bacterium]|nr:fibronectin type III domain-containing protein [Bacteroidales bacterium]